MIGFGSRIKARRTALGLTLRDVESITDGQISNAYLSQLENGKIKSPSARVAFALAAAYHVEASEMLDWLSEGTTIKPPPLCPTCGRARIGETWMERLGVVIDAARDSDRSPQGGDGVAGSVHEGAGLKGIAHD